jgi:hypothetical protein
MKIAPLPLAAPSPMKITCTSKKGMMEAHVREKLVDELVEFLKSVPVEEFKWNLKRIDVENVGREQEHACTAIGSVKDGKFNVGFVLFKRVDSNGNANDDSMESSCLDMMNIGKVIKQAIEEEKIEQEKRKQEPNFGGM